MTMEYGNTDYPTNKVEVWKMLLYITNIIMAELNHIYTYNQLQTVNCNFKQTHIACSKKMSSLFWYFQTNTRKGIRLKNTPSTNPEISVKIFENKNKTTQVDLKNESKWLKGIHCYLYWKPYNRYYEHLFSWIKSKHNRNKNNEPFNGHLSKTIWVSRYHKKHPLTNSLTISVGIIQ